MFNRNLHMNIGAVGDGKAGDDIEMKRRIEEKVEKIEDKVNKIEESKEELKDMFSHWGISCAKAKK